MTMAGVSDGAFEHVSISAMLIQIIGSADVHIDNVQSQGVCKSLGGEKSWRTCW